MNIFSLSSEEEMHMFSRVRGHVYNEQVIFNLEHLCLEFEIYHFWLNNEKYRKNICYNILDVFLSNILAKQRFVHIFRTI